MAPSINSIQSFVSVARPSANRAASGQFDSRLKVSSSGSADSSSVSAARSPDQLAQRSVTLKLSSSVSALNTREFVVENQSNTVTALLAKAREIKRETDPTRRERLVEDAQALIAGAEDDFASAVADDPNLAETQNVTIRTDSSSQPGDSSGLFTTSIGSVQSLASLGIDEDLSFDADDIDATIATLEDAQTTLATKSQSFESTRTDISNEVTTRGISATLRSDLASKDGIEEVAARLAQEITASTDGLIASGKVESLDVSSLLETQRRQEEEATAESGADSV